MNTASNNNTATGDGCLVLYDFYASWCIQCDVQRGSLERLSQTPPGQFVLERIDIDARPEYARKYNVTQVPALVIARGGQVLEHLAGLQPLETISAAVARQL